MKKCSLVLLVPLVLLLASTCFATIVNIPVVKKDFVRKTGAAFTDYLPFKAFSGLATMKIYNGGTQYLAGKVTDATIKINGTNVFNENEFKQKGKLLQKDIYLFEGDNDLEVSIEGKPGSLLNICISQVVNLEHNPYPGFPLLMQGSYLSMDNVIMEQIPYEIEDGSVVNVNVAKDQVVVQFKSDVDENTAINAINSINGEIISKIPITRLYLVKTTTGDINNFINIISKNAIVKYVFPNIVLENSLYNYKSDPIESTDKRYPYLEEINAYRAWGILNGRDKKNDIKIGILDKDWCKHGDAFESSDFEDRINNISIALFCNPFIAQNDHGVIVTAVAAAKGGENRHSNIGIDWESKIYVDDSTLGVTEGEYNVWFVPFFWRVLSEIEYMAGEGIGVINISQASRDGAKMQKLYIQKLAETLNEMNIEIKKYMEPLPLVVLAIGNNNEYIANNEEIFNSFSPRPGNLLIVGGSYRGERAKISSNKGSNYGSIVDIAAPWDMQNYYDYTNRTILSGYSGTSMSAPMVAGAASLLWSYSDIKIAADVANTLKITANGNISDFGNSGILDVCKALAKSFEIDQNNSCGISPPPTDTTSPILVGSNPADGAQDVSITLSSISFAFNEAMGPGFSVDWWGLNPNYFSTPIWSTDKKTITIPLTTSLPPATLVTWTLTGSSQPGYFADLAGNPLNPTAINGSFTTALAPNAGSYTLTVIPTLGGDNNAAIGINSSGQVVGLSSTFGNASVHGFLLYDYDIGPMIDLHLGPPQMSGFADAINNFGQVAGTTNATASRYTNGTWISLTGPYGYGRGINDSGQVVGEIRNSPVPTPWGPIYAFLYSDPGPMVDLGFLCGIGNNSYARGINNSGQVAGYCETPAGVTDSFIYDSNNGTMEFLPVISGGNSWAMDINNNGDVVGRYDTAGGERHAFLYSNGTVKDLGTLGGTFSYAIGINNSGQIVGASGTAGGPKHVFLYEQNSETMIDVTQLIVDTKGVSNITPQEINDSGQIVGFGLLDGNERAVILTPVNAPPN